MGNLIYTDIWHESARTHTDSAKLLMVQIPVVDLWWSSILTIWRKDANIWNPCQTVISSSSKRLVSKAQHAMLPTSTMCLSGFMVGVFGGEDSCSDTW